MKPAGKNRSAAARRGRTSTPACPPDPPQPHPTRPTRCLRRQAVEEPSAMQRLILASVLALAALGATATLAQTPAAPPASSATTTGAPAGFVAPAEPKPDETNAQRAKSQPGNNAPMWRSVRDQGGTST